MYFTPNFTSLPAAARPHRSRLGTYPEKFHVRSYVWNCLFFLLLFLLMSTLNGQTVVAWGRNDFGQTSVPDGLTDAVAVSAGGNHNLALRRNGTVVAWGSNQFGQRTIPAGLNSVTAIAAGGEHSLALLSDGTVRCWGWNISGQCNIPAGLSGVVAISARGNNSLAVKSDGTVVVWGDGSYGQVNLPAGSTDIVSASAGVCTMALRSNGTIVTFGGDAYGECSGVPVGLNEVVQVSAGFGGLGGGVAPNQSLALRSDGSGRAWGANFSGINSVPAVVSAEKVVGIAAGNRFNLVLTDKGSVLGWGQNDDGQVTIPEILQSGVTAISAGSFHSVAIRVTGVPGPTTTTTLTVNPIPVASGATYTVAYRVQSAEGTPLGTVTVRESFGGSCSGPAPEGVCTLTAGRLGLQSITADYESSSTHAASRGYAFQRILKGTVTTLLEISPSPAIAGQSYEVRFAVDSVDGPPPGNVTISDGTTTQDCPVQAGACSLPSGAAGRKTIFVLYPSNESYAQSVSSRAQDVVTSIVTLTPAQFSAGANAGGTPLTLGITPSVETWAASSNANWLTVSPSSGAGAAVLTVQYTANGNVASRTGVITIGNATMTVTQAGITGSAVLSANSAAVVAAGESGRSIVVTANAPDYTWTAISGQPWITVTSNTATTGSGVVAYNVAANASSIGRTGTITIAGATFTVNQAGVQPVFTIPTPSLTGTVTGGSGTIPMTVSPADAAWTATSSAAWFAVTPAQGTGSGSVSYSYPANPSVNSRTATVTIGGATFTLTQPGVQPVFTVGTSSVAGDLGGGSGSIPLSVSPADAPWTAVASAAWLTATPAQGTGPGNIAYTYAANSSVHPRTATLTIGGATFTVTQPGVPAVLSLPTT